MENVDSPQVYKPRSVRDTPLWQLLDSHFEQFEDRYDELFSKKFGFYRPVVSRAIGKFLECGDLHQGFARIQCLDCKSEYLLAFSCRGRYFCPSCHNKKVVQFAHDLKESVLFPVPHRQYVFSIPKILRKFFLYNRKMLGKLSQCATNSLKVFLRMVLRRESGIPGIVQAIQTFGDYGRWHPHIHAIVADGLFTESGYFYVMAKCAVKPLAELFRASVLKMLHEEGLIDDSFVKKILSWRHNSGFSVHNDVRIKAGDEKGLENLAQYIIRNTFSQSKLQYVPATDRVIYRSKMTHGKDKKNFAVLPHWSL